MTDEQRRHPETADRLTPQEGASTSEDPLDEVGELLAGLERMDPADTVGPLSKITGLLNRELDQTEAEI